MAVRFVTIPGQPHLADAEAPADEDVMEEVRHEEKEVDETEEEMVPMNTEIKEMPLRYWRSKEIRVLFDK